MDIDRNTLPRAIALQYDLGDIIYAAGRPPELRLHAFNGTGLRVEGGGQFAKHLGFLADVDFRRAHARALQTGGRKLTQAGDLRWHIHVALWAASQAARRRPTSCHGRAAT